jgi:hypothetical protein
MATGGERKVLGNGSGDYNKDYQETVHDGLFFLFVFKIITIMVILGWIDPELNPRKNGAGSGIGLALLFVEVNFEGGIKREGRGGGVVVDRQVFVPLFF